MNPIYDIYIRSSEDERKEFFRLIADTNVGMISNAVWAYYKRLMEGEYTKIPAGNKMEVNNGTDK